MLSRNWKYNRNCYRQSVVRALTEDGTKHLPVHMPEKIKKMSISGVPPLVRQNTMGDLEMIDLAPKVEGRIRKLDAQVIYSCFNVEFDIPAISPIFYMHYFVYNFSFV